MDKLLDDPKMFNRLPKWAQQEIKTLQILFKEVSNRLEVEQTKPESRMWHSRSQGSKKVYIPENDQVHMLLKPEERHSEIFMRIEKNTYDNHPYIYMSSIVDTLLIEPAGGVNCVKIYPKNLLTSH